MAHRINIPVVVGSLQYLNGEHVRARYPQAQVPMEVRLVGTQSRWNECLPIFTLIMCIPFMPN